MKLGTGEPPHHDQGDEPREEDLREESFRPQTLPDQLRELWGKTERVRQPLFQGKQIFWRTIAVWAASVTLLAFLEWGAMKMMSSGNMLINRWAGSSAFNWLWMELHYLNSQLTQVAGIQLVVWWQWRWPMRPPRWQLVSLAVAYAAFIRLIEFIPYLDSMSHVEFNGVAYMFFNSLISVAIFLFFIRSLETVVGFWWVHESDEGQHPVHPRSWSIAGLFLATLLFAIYMVTARWSQAIGNYPADFAFDGMQAVMLFWQATFIVGSLLLLYAAAFYVTTSSYVPLILALGSAIGLYWIGHTAFSLFAPVSWYQTFSWSELLNTAFSHLFAVALHLLCFRLRKRNGFELVGWVRGRGFVQCNEPSNEK